MAEISEKLPFRAFICGLSDKDRAAFARQVLSQNGALREQTGSLTAFGKGLSTATGAVGDNELPGVEIDAVCSDEFFAFWLSDDNDDPLGTAVCASNCDAAFLLVQQGEGLTEANQTICCLLSQLGVQSIILCVVGSDDADLTGSFASYADKLGVAGMTVSVSLDDDKNALLSDQVRELAHTADDKNGAALQSREGSDVSDQIAARIIWLDERAMLPGRNYTLSCANKTTTASISALKYRLNVETQAHRAAKTLQPGEFGFCNLSLAEPLPFRPFNDDPAAGGFFLIDQLSGAIAGIGMIEFGLRRATNIRWQELQIDKNVRAKMKNQKPCVLWFTGLSGSGKSTVASLLEKQLHDSGQHTYVLDGDNVRHGLNKDLGFTDADRVENIRRVAETARLFVDAGLIVLVSFISPFRSERRMAREMFETHEFLEVFVDTPLEVCEQRDPKGLYKKARAGEIKNFTGIDSDYEVPERADIVLQSAEHSPDDLVAQLIGNLQDRGLI